VHPHQIVGSQQGLQAAGEKVIDPQIACHVTAVELDEVEAAVKQGP